MERNQIGKFGAVMAVLAPICLAGAGCRGAEPPPIADVLPARPTPAPTGSLGFKETVAAGEMAWSAVPEELRYKIQVKGDNRKEMVGRLKAPLSSLRRSLSYHFIFDYEPPQALKSSDYQRGWIWLARGLKWGTEDALAEMDFQKAASNAALAIRFGCRMTGGDVTNAAFGSSMISDQLRLILPVLKTMPSSALGEISASVQAGLRDMPPPEVTLGYQLDASLINLQEILEAFKSETSRDRDRQTGRKMTEVVGKAAAKPLSWLKGNRDRAPWFFQSFRDEIVKVHQIIVTDAGAPVGSHTSGNPFDYTDKMWLIPGQEKKYQSRPWRDLLSPILAGHRIYLKEYPMLLSQLRLLGATATLENMARRDGQAPASIKALPEILQTDPYSGGKLGYASAGAQYKVWCAGEDGVDDGGLIDLGPTSRDLGLISTLEF